MSLARIALRIAAVEALKGRTLVDDRVLDTPNGALDVQMDGTLTTEENKPFVAVYTDVGKAEGIAGRSLTKNGACDIIFEIGVSMAMFKTDKQSGVTTLVGINIPASDGNQEFFLDIVQRQICDALTDPDNLWAEIYRGLHYRVLKIEFAGARNSDEGHRLAGHQMRITVDLADDPVKGEGLDPKTPLLKFLNAIEANEHGKYEAQASLMRSLITGSTEGWEQLQRRQGMTAAELLALGHGPLAADIDRATPPMVSGTLDVASRTPVTVADP